MLYEDVRLVSRFEAGGKHESVVGTALTWGQHQGPRHRLRFRSARFRRKATTFPPWIRSRSATTARSRTAAPSSALTRTTPGRRCGARRSPPAGAYDATSEKLHAQAQEVGGPLEVADDSRSDGAWSGDVSLLFRAIPVGNGKAPGGEPLWVVALRVQARGPQSHRGRRRRDPGARAHSFLGSRRQDPRARSARVQRLLLRHDVREHGGVDPRPGRRTRAHQRRGATLPRRGARC